MPRVQCAVPACKRVSGHGSAHLQRAMPLAKRSGLLQVSVFSRHGSLPPPQTDNISNKMALKAAGGAAGFPLTIATLQLGVGCIYALFLWVSPFPRVPHL